MFEKLEQLRKLPDHKKRYVAVGGALGITAIIFTFWVVSLTVTLSSQGQDASAAGAVATTESVSPFDALRANLAAAFVPVGVAFQDVASYFFGGKTATSTASTSGAATPLSINNTPVDTSTSAAPASTTPSSPTAALIDHLLIPGDTGPQVLLLQKVIAGQGFYNGPQNGKLGPATDAALISFQAKYNIVAPNTPGSGQVGPKTRDMVNQLLQQ